VNANFFKDISSALGFGKIQQPTYTVVKSLDIDSEIRSYPASKWIQTSMQGKASSLNSMSSPAFRRLFNYISGKNVEGKKIEMTSPVLMAMIPTNQGELINMNSDMKVDMKFYIDKSTEADMPIPNDSSVKITALGENTYAVIRFSGFAGMSDYIEKRNKLVKLLGQDANLYDTVNIMTAGYDAPWKIIGRRNEVWIPKK